MVANYGTKEYGTNAYSSANIDFAAAVAAVFTVAGGFNVSKQQDFAGVVVANFDVSGYFNYAAALVGTPVDAIFTVAGIMGREVVIFGTPVAASFGVSGHFTAERGLAGEIHFRPEWNGAFNIEAVLASAIDLTFDVKGRLYGPNTLPDNDDNWSGVVVPEGLWVVSPTPDGNWSNG